MEKRISSCIAGQVNNNDYRFHPSIKANDFSSAFVQHPPKTCDDGGTDGIFFSAVLISVLTMASSPDTDEFLRLEKSFVVGEELQDEEGRKKVLHNELQVNRNNKYSLFSHSALNEFFVCFQSKLEERRRSVDNNGGAADDEENSLQLMERRGLRQFTRADEYLYAMKEDLAEWLNVLYPWIDMTADNFMDRLETGEHLIRVSKVKQCTNAEGAPIVISQRWETKQLSHSRKRAAPVFFVAFVLSKAQRGENESC